MSYIMGSDFFISAFDFDTEKVYGATKLEGALTGIALNSEISEEKQDDTQDHELRHLVLEHMYQKEKSRAEKELEAESYGQ